MPARYYVKKSGNIRPGDTLWDHGPGANGNNNATTEVDVDTGQRSKTMIGTAKFPLAGDRIIVVGTDLVIDRTSKGAHAPGTLVGHCMQPAATAAAVAAAAATALLASRKPIPSAPQAAPDPDPAPVQVDGPKDDLIGDALTRDPDTGKPIKKPYVPDKHTDFIRDDLFDMLRDVCG